MSGSRFPDIHTFTVDKAGILKLMQDLNPHKAEGPDHIPTRFLKEFAAKLSPAMTLIFQASLQQGKVPDDWKQANVAPIFKKKDRSTAANYRTISLISVCSKIIEHIIHSQIMRHLDIHQILTEILNEAVMREPADTHTVQDLAAALEENEQVGAILLDLSKAFDNRRIKIPEYARTLQKYLAKLQEWERDWQMSYNASKGEVIRVMFTDMKSHQDNLYNTWS